MQPASLDLRLGAKATRVRASFLPGPDFSVTEKLQQLALHEFAARRRRGAGDGLRLYRAAASRASPFPPTSRRAPIRKARPAGSMSSRASSPTRRAPSTRWRRDIAGRSSSRSARARFRSWCAPARGCRRSASAAATRCSTTRRSKSCTRRRCWRAASRASSTGWRSRSTSKATATASSATAPSATRA